MPRISGDRYLTREENSEQRHRLDTQLARVAEAWARAWNSPELRLLDASHKSDATKDLGDKYRGLKQERRDLDL